MWKCDCGVSGAQWDVEWTVKCSGVRVDWSEVQSRVVEWTGVDWTGVDWGGSVVEGSEVY